MTKPQEQPIRSQSEDDILRRMLGTKPKPQEKKPEPAKKKPAAK